jgi:hypothetical protein
VNDLGRVGRSNLLTLVRQLQSELADARQQRDHAVDMARRQMVLEGCLTCSGGAEYKAMLSNLSDVQTRCTQLLEENRSLCAGLLLPGWFCSKCSVFTGTAKEELTECRACGAPR